MDNKITFKDLYESPETLKESQSKTFQDKYQLREDEHIYWYNKTRKQLKDLGLSGDAAGSFLYWFVDTFNNLSDGFKNEPLSQDELKRWVKFWEREHSKKAISETDEDIL